MDEFFRSYNDICSVCDDWIQESLEKDLKEQESNNTFETDIKSEKKDEIDDGEKKDDIDDREKKDEIGDREKKDDIGDSEKQDEINDLQTCETAKDYIFWMENGIDKSLTPIDFDESLKSASDQESPVNHLHFPYYSSTHQLVTFDCPGHISPLPLESPSTLKSSQNVKKKRSKRQLNFVEPLENYKDRQSSSSTGRTLKHVPKRVFRKNPYGNRMENLCKILRLVEEKPEKENELKDELEDDNDDLEEEEEEEHVIKNVTKIDADHANEDQVSKVSEAFLKAQLNYSQQPNEQFHIIRKF